MTSERDREVLATVYAMTRNRPLPLAAGQGTLAEPESLVADDVRQLRDVAARSGAAGPSASDALDTQMRVVGMDVECHAVAPWAGRLMAAGVTWAQDLHGCASGSRVVVAGVRSVVHTPPTRSGIRVVFITLDDPTGLVDLAFFPAAQGRHTAAAMTSRFVVAEGTVTHTPPRSVNIAGMRAWDMQEWLSRRHPRA